MLAWVPAFLPAGLPACLASFPALASRLFDFPSGDDDNGSGAGSIVSPTANNGFAATDAEDSFPNNSGRGPPLRTMLHPPLDPFQGLFIDSPHKDGGAHNFGHMETSGLDAGIRAHNLAGLGNTGATAGGDRTSTSEEPGGDDADIFELSVEDAARRLQLQ